MSTPSNPKLDGFATLMEAKFGANWRTTTAGIVFGVSLSVASTLQASPELLPAMGIPEHIAEGIKAFCGLLTGAAGMVGMMLAKDRNVTGGTVAATSEAQHRVETKEEDS